MKELKKRLFSLFFLIVCSDSVTSYRLNTAVGSSGSSGTCKKAAKRANALENASVIIDTPESLHGKWVSESCETRSGPEFLLRSYTFNRNGSFKLVQHYYGDESCSTPVYTAVARGKLRENGQYSLTKVGLVPHSAEVAQQLELKFESACSSIPKKRWRRLKEYLILNLPDDSTPPSFRPFTTSTSHQGVAEKSIIYSGNKRVRMGHQSSFNCLQSISLVFHELQHYKVQIKPAINDDFFVTHYRQELLLGDIHSRLEGRASYKPTAYQPPLLKVDKNIADTLGIESESLIRSDSVLNIENKAIEFASGKPRQKSYVGNFDFGRVGDLDSIVSSQVMMEDKKEREVKPKILDVFHHCPICATIDSSNEKKPPMLIRKPNLPLILSGEWVSLHCEARSTGLFLMRHFKFFSGDNTWFVEYNFYSDSVCSDSSFSVTAAGHFDRGPTSYRTPGGTEYDFHVERASLTVLDQRMIENLEQDSSCGLGPWKIGVPREMSSTHGCATLGLVVPSTEYELLKMEIDYNGSFMLYMGQADTDNRRRTSKERPSAYQPPLIQCANLPPYSESLRQILSSPLYGEDVYNNYDFRLLEMDSENSSSISKPNILLALCTIVISLLSYL